jgi:hypothetical protein
MNPREEIGEWRKLHNEELHHSYSSTNYGDQIKEGETGEHVARITKIKPTWENSIGKPQ